LRLRTRLGGVVCKLSFSKDCFNCVASPESQPAFLGFSLCATSTRGFSLAPARLLLVDDDESVLTGLGALLAGADFEVTTASNVIEALRQITNQNFDVLLTDLHMPGDGDGLIVVSAMRHANPKAVTLLLSANPDMTRATAAILRQVDEILLKSANAGSILQSIRQRLAQEGPPPRSVTVEAAATVLERESVSVTQAWLQKMKESGGLTAAPITEEEQSEYLPAALDEIVYRLRYPQTLGTMTLFSMASLQHGARRRRQGFGAPLLVEEARALQVALFETILKNLEQIGIGQLAGTLMAIADEVNAQLLQSLSGYENEKSVAFPEDDRGARTREMAEPEKRQGPEIEKSIFPRKLHGYRSHL
jgi:CheY-like chemotaxis protein